MLSIGLGACGGGGGKSDVPATQVVKRTFSSNKAQASSSGKLALTVSATAVGGGQDGTFKARLSGPFDARTKREIPKFDFRVTINGHGSVSVPSVSAGAVSTGDRGFLLYNGDAFEAPSSTFAFLKSAFASASSKTRSQTDLSQLGIDPQGWVKGLRNEGTEDFEGAKTIHVSGSIDVPKLVNDFTDLAGKAGTLGIPSLGSGVRKPSADEIRKIEKAVEKADFDLYTGADDYKLRGLVLDLAIRRPEGETSGPDRVRAKLDLRLSGLGEDQRIEAPANPKPLGDLLGGLGGLGAMLGPGGGSSGGGNALDDLLKGGSAGGTSTAPGPGNSQRYLDCIQKAKDPAALNKCAQLLSR